MAYELSEKLIDYSEVHFVGIQTGGSTFAKILQAKVEAILDIEIGYSDLSLNKKDPAGSILISPAFTTQNSNSCLVLIDDVLQSGRTMTYALAECMGHKWDGIITCVLVDRQHGKYPVKADVAGMSLSTTLQENIDVTWNGNQADVFLV